MEQQVIQLRLEVQDLHAAQQVHLKEFSQLKTHLKVIAAAILASSAVGPLGPALLKFLGGV